MERKTGLSIMAYLDLKFPKGYVKFFKGSYTMAWRRIKAVGKLAGVDVHPHMLRHTFATELLKRGENIVTIGKIMDHESLDTTRKYTKLADIAMVKPKVGACRPRLRG